MPLSPEAIIKQLGLVPLDREGGYFRRTFTSAIEVENNLLGPAYAAGGTHRLGTVIQFLVTTDGFSAMHRVRSPEVWFFHLGDPLEMLLLNEDGSGSTLTIGPDLLSGHRVQVTVPAGTWQGCRLMKGGSHGWSLCSAAVIPGFEWEDFELGDAEPLIRGWPDHVAAIRARVRTQPATELP